MVGISGATPGWTGECLLRRRILPEGREEAVGQLGSWPGICGRWMSSRIESPAHLSAGHQARVCQSFCFIIV